MQLIAAVGSRNKGVAEKRDTKALLAKRPGNRVNVALRRWLHKGVGCSKSWKRESTVEKKNLRLVTMETTEEAKVRIGLDVRIELTVSRVGDKVERLTR